MRKILREDGIDVDALPKPAPKIASLAAAVQPPLLVADRIPDRVARLESEVKIMTDILLEVAPVFEPTLDLIRRVENQDFRIKVKLSPSMLGPVLMALYTNGVTPSDISVQRTSQKQIKVELVHLPPPPIREPTTIQPVKVTEEPLKIREQDVLQLLREQGPLSLYEMRDRLGIKSEKTKKRIENILSIAKNKGSLVRPDKKGGRWSLKQ